MAVAVKSTEAPRDVSIYEITIQEWTDKFATLYAEPDKRRRLEDFWVAVMAHLSVIGESIRKTDYDALMRAAAHAFCWMCGIANHAKQTDMLVFRVSHSLPEMVALKFPHTCGHCITCPCRCKPDAMDMAQDKSAKYKTLLEKWLQPTAWDKWTIKHFLAMFEELFGGQIHIQTLENIGFHLLEEAGEEAKAIRQLGQFRGIVDRDIAGIDRPFLEKIANIPGLVAAYEQSISELREKVGGQSEKEVKSKLSEFLASDDPAIVKARLVFAKMDFVIEMADTFSWFCGVLIKIRKIGQQFNKALVSDCHLRFNIEDALSDEYLITTREEPARCYACKGDNCQCQIFF